MPPHERQWWRRWRKARKGSWHLRQWGDSESSSHPAATVMQVCPPPHATKRASLPSIPQAHTGPTPTVFPFSVSSDLPPTSGRGGANGPFALGGGTGALGGRLPLREGGGTGSSLRGTRRVWAGGADSNRSNAAWETACTSSRPRESERGRASSDSVCDPRRGGGGAESSCLSAKETLLLLDAASPRRRGGGVRLDEAMERGVEVKGGGRATDVSGGTSWPQSTTRPDHVTMAVWATPQATIRTSGMGDAPVAASRGATSGEAASSR
jgi:hypothetical protein